MTTKPTIVLVPGAWHPPSAFSPLTIYLESHSYTVHALTLPSVNSNPPQPDFTSDVTAIASTLSSLCDSHKSIILLTHSYGGIPGSSACKGLLASQRAPNTGGVKHIIYCTSFCLPLGACLMDALHHEPLPWWQFPSEQDRASHSELRSTLNIRAATPKETFYNTLPSSTADSLTATLSTQSYGAFWSGVSFAAWDECECTFIVCGKDEAIPEIAQRGMCDAVDAALEEKAKSDAMEGKGEGEAEPRKINRVVLEEADHTPFWGETERVGDVVRKAAGESI